MASTLEELKELNAGDEVTVISAGDFQLVDVASGVLYPANTEVTVPLYGFVEDQINLGNLKIAGSDDAPKANKDNKALSGMDAIKYNGGEDSASRSKATQDAFGEEPRTDEKASEGKDEISQGARSGAKGTSRKSNTSESAE